MVEWQLMQLAVAGIWLVDLPVAAVPLWQLVQLVAAVKPLWLTLAPTHALTVWQATQLAVVARWLPGLPVARVPL